MIESTDYDFEPSPNKFNGEALCKGKPNDSEINAELRLKNLKDLLVSDKNLTCFTWNKSDTYTGMLAYRTSLKHITLKNAKVIKTAMAWGCANLISVKAEKAEVISSRSFFECFCLSTLIIPNTEIIGECAFYSCHSLKWIDLPQLKRIDREAFDHCLSLERIRFNNLIRVNCRAFDKCINLSCVSMPSCRIIEAKAFRGCKRLHNIELPKVNLRTDSEEVFKGCSSLKNAFLPDTDCLPDGTFKDCKTLESVILGGTEVVKISWVQYVFEGCENYDFMRFDPLNSVQFVDYSGETPKIVDNLGNEINNNINAEEKPKKSGAVYVPDNLVEAYKNDEKWSELASYQIKGLSEMPSSLKERMEECD